MALSDIAMNHRYLKLKGRSTELYVRNPMVFLAWWCMAGWAVFLIFTINSRGLANAIRRYMFIVNYILHVNH